MGGSSRHQTRTAVCRVVGCVGDCDVAMSHGACVRRSPLFSGENSAQMLRTLERMPCFTSQLLQNSTNVACSATDRSGRQGVNCWG